MEIFAAIVMALSALHTAVVGVESFGIAAKATAPLFRTAEPELLAGPPEDVEPAASPATGGK